VSLTRSASQIDRRVIVVAARTELLSVSMAERRFRRRCSHPPQAADREPQGAARRFAKALLISSIDYRFVNTIITSVCRAAPGYCMRAATMRIVPSWPPSSVNRLTQERLPGKGTRSPGLEGGRARHPIADPRRQTLISEQSYDHVSAVRRAITRMRERRVRTRVSYSSEPGRW